MFNFLVSGLEESWNGEPWVIDRSRCVREYTSEDITEAYASLNSESIKKLTQFPCIFAYEQSCAKDPMFGKIKEVRTRGEDVQIKYEIVEVQPFLTFDDLDNMYFELDLGRWELSRTHWAVKNIDLHKVLRERNVAFPSKGFVLEKPIDIIEHNFMVSLSFPGEVRQYVESVAAELDRILGPNTCFYDNYYRAQLARPSLDVLLQDIYRKRSDLIVVFLCSSYQDKKWPGLEFRAIREIIMEKEYSRVMFIKMDDGQVDGVFEVDGYIDGREFDAIKVAEFIKERAELNS